MAGRPTKYRPEFVGKAVKLCALGATDAQLADFFEVHIDTISEWKSRHAEFSEALKAAKSELDAKVERSLYERATGYTHEAVKIFQYEGEPVIVPYIERYPPDPTSMIFWLKNRQSAKWRDKQDVEHSGNITVHPINFAGPK